MARSGRRAAPESAEEPRSSSARSRSCAHGSVKTLRCVARRADIVHSMTSGVAIRHVPQASAFACRGTCRQSGGSRVRLSRRRSTMTESDRPGSGSAAGAAEKAPGDKVAAPAHVDLLAGAAAARHRRLSAHDRAAVRRTREIGPRAGSGDEGGQADPAGRPEERRAGRSVGRRHLPGRHGVHDPAAAEAAGRHREGAGRRRQAREDHRLQGDRELFRGVRRADAGSGRRARRNWRRWGAPVVSQFEQYIKLNKKIAPEVLVSLNQIEEPSKLADTVAAI